uniref:[histone H4]-lysine(20) N-methyltransferase n=1 Tax=Amphilophus citrinellus TaxID=61819 RepID=A0A3Q0RI97_AMPCI
MPSAQQRQNQRQISQRTVTASVHPAGQMNSRHLRSSTAPKPAFIPIPDSPSPSAMPIIKQNGCNSCCCFIVFIHYRLGGENSQNRKVTDFYPVRRSSRKSKTELKCEQKKLIDDLITNGIEEGMEVQHIEGKGRAVFATRCFQKGDYVVEYHGDLLQITDAKKREAEYAQNPATGCYMYYFQYLCKTYCVDATKETGRMGRLINHSKNGNCQTKLHDINGVPHLILIASRNIDKGEELLYDYGDRSKASIAAHPWLKY